MIETPKHLHIYQRVRGSKKQFFCLDPDCAHRNVVGYMINTRAQCPLCFDSYVVRKDMLRLAKPHCRGCTKKKDLIVDEAMNDLMEDLL